MRHSVAAERAVSHARWSFFVSGCNNRAKRQRQLTTSTAAGIAFCLAMALSAMTAKAVAANSDDASLSALRDYVQSVATTSTDARISDRDVTKSTFAALRNFARQIGDKQPPSTKGATKLAGAVNPAGASNLFDFLRGLQNGTAPSATPNGPVAGGKNSSAPVAADYVGAKVCMTCHAAQAASFAKTLMGRIGKRQKGKFDCENCHGPGSAHVKAGGGRGVGGIISFRPNDKSRTAEQNNSICLTCHEHGDRTLWRGSMHQTRGLMCTNCHTIMKAVSRKHQLKTASQLDTCFQCHKDIRAKLLRSAHMPLPEGKMVCTNCHNPHGSYTEHLLKQATVNEVCFQCHAEKRGPFLWEHPPVVENCLNCHDPHGTINDNLLKVSRPRLCQRCHNAATRHPANPRNPMQIQAINSGCVNCHSQIHGSNNPGGDHFLR
jgi:DmsE family decaheme c-type cytochrome